jgi:hypothetical protein
LEFFCVRHFSREDERMICGQVPEEIVKFEGPIEIQRKNDESEEGAVFILESNPG